MKAISLESLANELHAADTCSSTTRQFDILAARVSNITDKAGKTTTLVQITNSATDQCFEIKGGESAELIKALLSV